VAAGVAWLVEGGTPVQSTWSQGAEPPPGPERGDRADRPPRERKERGDAGASALPPMADEEYAFEEDGQQIVWRLAIGHRKGAQPSNIVGAIANEARLHGSQINGLDIRADYTLVRLPAALPRAVIERLSQVRVRGQALNLEAGGPPRPEPKGHRKGAPKKAKR
jgi:ATP-dependent RNA helicase DeaD